MTVHMPGPVYVAAFTLAHLGREPEARAMLERQRQKWYLHPDPPQARPGADEKAPTCAGPNASTLMKLSLSACVQE